MAGISAAFIVLLFGVAVGFILHREDRRRRQVAEYLDSYRDSKAQSMLREEYEEYVEAWVHEVKVPLSLMALLSRRAKRS